jgi:integrase
MGIIEVSTGVWLLDARIEKDGKQYRKREKLQSGKKVAEARYAELLKELRTRAKKEPRSLTITTFKQVIDYYLERNTVDKDSKYYFNRMTDDLGNVQIADLQERFDKYLLILRQSKRMYTTRRLSNNTINRYISWSKAAINFAVRAGLIEKNPLQHFQKLPTQPRDRMLTAEEKKKLLDAVMSEAPHIYPIILYSLLVPSRCGELKSLKRTDYNMLTNTIHIPGERTKNKRPCIKPVPDCLVEYMRSVPVESEFLFFRTVGKKRSLKYLPLGNFRKSFIKCLKKAEIENYRFHDQRRVAYTDLLLAGNAPHIVMQVSGHKTDMSKVYFGRNELLAAKSVSFGGNPYSSAVLLKGATA